MMGACALTLGACVDEVPSDDFGPSPAVESNGVYFPNTMETSYMLGTASETEDTEKTGSFTLPVERTNPGEAATVEVTTEMDAETAAVFSVPTSVTFEAGSATSELVVNYTAAQRGVTYTLNISFGEETEYAASYQTITALYPALEIWEPISTEAVYIDQMFSPFGVSDLVIEGVTVEKLQGKYRYRIRSPYDDTPRIEEGGVLYSYWNYLFGLPKFMEDGFEIPYIELNGEAILPAKDDGSREYTEEELADLDESQRLYYIDITSLGFRMENGVGISFDPTWETFGSTAYNLGNSSGAFTEEDYPLGSYNKSKEMFDFGSVFHNIDGVGFYPMEGFQLWLNPAKMTVVYDRDYQPWIAPEPAMTGTFSSMLMTEDGVKPLQYMVTVSQGTLPEGETDPIYRLESPYGQANIAFFHNKETGTLRVPKGQATGMDVFGNMVYVDVTKASYDAESDTYTFECDFYYNVEEDGKTTKSPLTSTVEKFTAGWMPGAEDLQGASIDDFAGTYNVFFDAFAAEKPVTLTKANDYTLVSEGLTPYLSHGLGGDTGYEFYYYPNMGMIVAMYEDVYLGDVPLMALPGDMKTGSLYTTDALLGGFDAAGNLVFVNAETNGANCNAILFLAQTQEGLSIMDYCNDLQWTPATASAAAAVAPEPITELKAMQFERVVRHFMPKFDSKPAAKQNGPKVLKHIEVENLPALELIKK